MADGGVIWTFASTNVFTASAPSPAGAAAAARFTVNPPPPGAVDARSVVTPAACELSVTEHSPVVPTVLQLAALNEPGPLTSVKLTPVSAGAFAKPEPSLTFTC